MQHPIAYAERRSAKSTPKRAVLQLSQPLRPHEQAQPFPAAQRATSTPSFATTVKLLFHTSGL
jgi:hypothetical protein